MAPRARPGEGGGRRPRQGKGDAADAPGGWGGESGAPAGGEAAAFSFPLWLSSSPALALARGRGHAALPVMAAHPPPAWDSLDFGDKWIKTLRAVARNEAVPDLEKDLVDRWGLRPRKRDGDASSPLRSLELKREQWQKEFPCECPRWSEFLSALVTTPALYSLGRYIGSVEIWLPRDFEAEKVSLPLQLLSWASGTKLLMLRHVELSWQAGPDPRLSIGELWLHHVSFRAVGAQPAQQPPRPAWLHIDLAGSISIEDCDFGRLVLHSPRPRSAPPKFLYLDNCPRLESVELEPGPQELLFPWVQVQGCPLLTTMCLPRAQETSVFPGPLLRELVTGPCWPTGAAPEACKCTLHGLHSERTSVQGPWADRLVLAEAPLRGPGENKTPAALGSPCPGLTLAWHAAGLPAWFSRDLLQPTDCKARLEPSTLQFNTATTRPPARPGDSPLRPGDQGGRPSRAWQAAPSSLARATAAAADVYPWLLAAAEFPPGSARRLGFLLQLQLRHGLVLSARDLEAWAGLGQVWDGGREPPSWPAVLSASTSLRVPGTAPWWRWRSYLLRAAWAELFSQLAGREPSTLSPGLRFLGTMATRAADWARSRAGQPAATVAPEFQHAGCCLLSAAFGPHADALQRAVRGEVLHLVAQSGLHATSTPGAPEFPDFLAIQAEIWTSLGGQSPGATNSRTATAAALRCGGRQLHHLARADLAQLEERRSRAQTEALEYLLGWTRGLRSTLVLGAQQAGLLARADAASSSPGWNRLRKVEEEKGLGPSKALAETKWADCSPRVVLLPPCSMFHRPDASPPPPPNFLSLWAQAQQTVSQPGGDARLQETVTLLEQSWQRQRRSHKTNLVLAFEADSPASGPGAAERWSKLLACLVNSAGLRDLWQYVTTVHLDGGSARPYQLVVPPELFLFATNATKVFLANASFRDNMWQSRSQRARSRRGCRTLREPATT
eukprot:g40818.t1